MQLSTEDDLRRIGRRMEAAGRYIALYGTVLVLASIGGLKFTAYGRRAFARWSRRARS